MKCPICNQYEFKDEYDICKVCFWENDLFQYENKNCLGSNRSSLVDYKANWERIDAILPKLITKYNIKQDALAHYKYDMLVIHRDKIKAFINELTECNIKCRLNYYNICRDYKLKYASFVGYPYINSSSVKENNDECINIIFSDDPIEICKKYEFKQLLKIIKRSKNKKIKWEEIIPFITIEIE